MSAMQRNKGKAGEREIAKIIKDLTGWDVRRRVRQHDGDSDLVGVPGWSVEVKRHKTVTRSDLRNWWQQTINQCCDGEVPVLFYRRDKDEWRAVYTTIAKDGEVNYKTDYQHTLEASVLHWANFARLLYYKDLRGN